MAGSAQICLPQAHLMPISCPSHADAEKADNPGVPV
jgi:hypothetical protein